VEKTVQSPQHIEALSPEETRLMLHELHVHQIELEMQNEELRRAHVELGTARRAISTSMTWPRWVIAPSASGV